jgi:hypothetical protein
MDEVVLSDPQAVNTAAAIAALKCRNLNMPGSCNPAGETKDHPKPARDRIFAASASPLGTGFYAAAPFTPPLSLAQQNV